MKIHGIHTQGPFFPEIRTTDPTPSSQNEGRIYYIDEMKFVTDSRIVPIGFPRKNVIINGDFDVWQRETTFNPLTHWDYCADRWVFPASGSMGIRIDRSTDVPTDSTGNILLSTSKYSLKAEVTTAQTTINSSDYGSISQFVEGYVFYPLVGNKATLQFWVKSSKTGTYCVHFHNSGATQSWVSEYTIDSTNWEFKNIVIDLSELSGTWKFDNNAGIKVEFALGVGSNFHTSTTDQWLSGNYSATNNQVNWFDTVGNTFQLSQVQMTSGINPTRFEVRPYVLELALCQRYYYKRPSGTLFYGYQANASDTYRNWWIQHPVPMRTSPTISWISNHSWGSVAPDTEINNLHMHAYRNAGNTTSSLWLGLWEADAEL